MTEVERALVNVRAILTFEGKNLLWFMDQDSPLAGNNLFNREELYKVLSEITRNCEIAISIINGFIEQERSRNQYNDRI